MCDIKKQNNPAGKLELSLRIFHDTLVGSSMWARNRSVHGKKQNSVSCWETHRHFRSDMHSMENNCWHGPPQRSLNSDYCFLPPMKLPNVVGEGETTNTLSQAGFDPDPGVPQRLKNHPSICAWLVSDGCGMNHFDIWWYTLYLRTKYKKIWRICQIKDPCKLINKIAWFIF